MRLLRADIGETRTDRCSNRHGDLGDRERDSVLDRCLGVQTTKDYPVMEIEILKYSQLLAIDLCCICTTLPLHHTILSV